MVRRLVVGCICLAALLFVAGCGSSSDEEPLTKAQYVKRANAICEKAVTERDKGILVGLRLLEKSGDAEDSAKQEELVTDVALPPLRRMVTQLEALNPPEGQEDEVDAFIEGFDEAVGTFEADPSLALGAESREPFTEPSKLATQYGLNECRWV